MAQHQPISRSKRWMIGGIVIIAMLFMAACNLSPQTPQDLITNTPPINGLEPQDDTTQNGGTSTPGIQDQPTNTPVPDLLPSETIGPITVDGAEHRTQEVVTVRVRRGISVSSATCNWVLQDTGASGELSAPTTTQADENFYEDVYTFTPQQAGTYAVNCTGVATTQTGQRPVGEAGSPFTVEAKG